jgi:hypothetical protein
MEVVIKKYVTGSFVETYEQTFVVPDDLDPDDYEGILEHLKAEDALYDADWGDRVHFDDNETDVEYEVEGILDSE